MEPEWCGRRTYPSMISDVGVVSCETNVGQLGGSAAGCCLLRWDAAAERFNEKLHRLGLFSLAWCPRAETLRL